MNAELKRIIQSDIFRYFGRENLSLMERISLPIKEVSLCCTITYRKAHYYCKHGKKIRGILYRLKLNYLSRKYLFQIPYTANIGEGFCIVHFGRIIVAPTVSIGKNCNIFTGVTIGSETRGKRSGVPEIGNNVWIGPNAVIVGNIKIGDDVLIAGNAYVNFDVPDHSIVVGNPAQVKPSNNATGGYICRRI